MKGLEMGEVRVLLQHDHMRARHDAAQPFVRFHAPCNQLQQRRLASAIAPDERQTTAFTDVEVKALEQPAAARSEEHTSELQSLMRISSAIFCLNKKQQTTIPQIYHI